MKLPLRTLAWVCVCLLGFEGSLVAQDSAAGAGDAGAGNGVQPTDSEYVWRNDAKAGASERLRRAREWASTLGGDAMAVLEPLLSDPDPDVRFAWLEWATRADLLEAGVDQRVARALEALAEEQDREEALRWLEALARWETPAIRSWMASEWRLAEPWRAVALAEALRPNPQNRAILLATLTEWAGGASSHLWAPRTVAELLPNLGPILADAPKGDLRPLDLQPIVVGLSHPDRGVAEAAQLALQGLFDRLVSHDDVERTETTLEVLLESGLPRRVLRFEETRLAFFPLADGERALAAAQGLGSIHENAVPGAGETAQRLARWRFRSRYLTGMAHLSLLEHGKAGKAFATALKDNDLSLAPLVAAGPEETGGDLAQERAELLQERILILFGAALADHLAEADAEPSDFLPMFLKAHRLHLEVQVLYAGRTGLSLGGWDALFENPLSPYRLLLHGRSFRKGLDLEGSLDWEDWLARGLASVSAKELPGFRPWPEADTDLANPLGDLLRRGHIEAIQWARLDHLMQEMDGVQRRVGLVQSSPLFQVPEKGLTRLGQLDRERRMLLRQIEQDGRFQGAGSVLEVRVAGGHALRLARNLRSAGRLLEARELVLRFQADLADGGIGTTWYYLGQERMARADLELGSNLSDAEKPKEAEVALEKGVERLQGIRDRLNEVNAGADVLKPFEELLANAYVSLAVNANVRLLEPERAAGYCEKAYALKQDEFMRVLLACYRARSGQASESRALLESVNPAPPLYYNLACTHALLGDVSKALYWLRKEFEENGLEPAALQRQKDWAERDPDLTALRDLPEFRRLLE